MQTATTNNGALSHEKTGNRLLDFYYKVLRQTSKENVIDLLSKSWEIDPKNTFKLIFQLRDCRGGKGERRAFQWCIEWLMANGHSEWVLLNLKNIPEFGSFKDLVFLMDSKNNEVPYDITFEVYKLWAKCLILDVASMKDGKPISLASKWFPKEGRSFDKKNKSATKLAGILEISTRSLRKDILVPLNKHLDTVEIKMCAKDWEQIKYNRVPSLAMKNLKKAFERHDPDGFTDYIKSVENGTNSINANQLFPHQIVKDYFESVDRVREEQWKVLVKNSVSLSNCIAMVDTSGSMIGYGNEVSPIDVACALGLLVATNAKEPFNGLMLTFSETPQFFEINTKKTLLGQLQRIRKGPWGMSTNFQSAFDMILSRAIKFELNPEDMPRRLIVISDMQFNEANSRNNKTNFETVKLKYRKVGYEMPTIIFWNVVGSTGDVPITENEQGAILISGFSQSVLKYLISEDDFGPDSVIKQILENERYNSLVIPKK